ncbi:MAG: threonine synthase [Bacteroidetes bacterium]|jgi:threonine synthase|nr:threonine synthase [Bacteroidota bacterium]
MADIKSALSHLECSKTGATYDPFKPMTLSSAGAPLLARYDISKAKRTLTRNALTHRRTDMWRYTEMMPINNLPGLHTLGEGGTPLRKAPRFKDPYGLSSLFIKDESVNPTGSFKARGLSAAVNAALERGIDTFAIPSAGNAGGALAAYAALSGTRAHIFMPADTPSAFIQECRSAGADVVLVDGLISDCGDKLHHLNSSGEWFNVSTLKEPYRIEGKKTMGYELFEQLDGVLPDVIIYPTGGGTGLIGMWKAFNEMEELGWIGSERPRMVSVQASGCAPIVRAWQHGQSKAEYWQNAKTSASGLRVPAAIGDFIILDILKKSNGCAIAVSDEEMIHYSNEMAHLTGIFPAPEGGATLATLHSMLDKGLVKREETIVLFNTGSGYKYLEAFSNSGKKHLAN